MSASTRTYTRYSNDNDDHYADNDNIEDNDDDVDDHGDYEDNDSDDDDNGD